MVSKHTKTLMFGSSSGTRNEFYGVCNRCKENFVHGDIIIAKRTTHKKKYWHKACAELIKII